MKNYFVSSCALKDLPENTCVCYVLSLVYFVSLIVYCKLTVDKFY